MGAHEFLQGGEDAHHGTCADEDEHEAESVGIRQVKLLSNCKVLQGQGIKALQIKQVGCKLVASWLQGYERSKSMSILIKGMEMPKDCQFCAFRYEDEDSEIYCNALHRYVCDAGKECPLVEVPKPHGRLIDEDNVINAIHKRMEELQENPVFKRKHGDVDLLGVKPYITEISTVIEAEGQEDEHID